MKKILTILILSLMFVQAKAQTDEEYRMEIGAGVGLVAYEGDFNGSVLSNMQFGGSVVLRRVFNPYMGLKMSAMYGKLTGASKDVKTYYPDFVNNPYSFSNTLIDASVTYEYNFWPYGTGRDYRGAKRFTPFIFGGLGTTWWQERLHSECTTRLGREIQDRTTSEPRTRMGCTLLAERQTRRRERPLRHRKQRTLQKHRLLLSLTTHTDVQLHGEMSHLPQRG